jgi:hypothetical protein
VTVFYDSAGREFPAGATHVMLYADGRYAVPPADARWRYVRWITVLGGEEAALYAGAIDFEKGNEAFDAGRLKAWVAGRKAHKWLARVYCSLADLPAAHAAVGAEPNVRFWLADWGKPLTAEHLAARALDQAKVRLPVYVLWGQQYQGNPSGGFDTSVLYGVW